MIDENGSAAQTQPLADILAVVFFRAVHDAISYHRHRLYARLRTGGRERIAALAHQERQACSRRFVAVANANPLPPLPSANFSWARSRIPPIWFARLWHRARLPLKTLTIERWIGPVDLYHATDFVLPPTRRKTRTVLTVHDLSFVRAPEAASPALKRYLDAVVPRSVHRADYVLADSQATKDDLIALYGADPQKIEVLLSGVNQRFQPIRDPSALATIR